MLRSMTALVKVETTFPDITSAVKIANETGASWKKWDDLVIVAQMRRLGIDEIYSNDSDFNTLGVRRIF